MTSNTNKNVICVKDIPSNIIEEAIFILKDEIDEDTVDIRKEIAKDEAEEFLSEYVINLEDIKKKNVNRAKYKITLKQIIYGIAAIFLGTMILMFIK